MTRDEAKRFARAASEAGCSTSTSPGEAFLSVYIVTSPRSSRHVRFWRSGRVDGLAIANDISEPRWLDENDTATWWAFLGVTQPSAEAETIEALKERIRELEAKMRRGRRW